MIVINASVHTRVSQIYFGWRRWWGECGCAFCAIVDYAALSDKLLLLAELSEATHGDGTQSLLDF